MFCLYIYITNSTLKKYYILYMVVMRFLVQNIYGLKICYFLWENFTYTLFWVPLIKYTTNQWTFSQISHSLMCKRLYYTHLISTQLLLSLPVKIHHLSHPSKSIASLQRDPSSLSSSRRQTDFREPIFKSYKILVAVLATAAR